MQSLINSLIYQPILQTLLFFDHLTGNFGAAIILLTLAIRTLLIPLTLPGMKMSVKMRDLQPELNKLKSQYAKDKAGLQKAQMALFQEHRVNPASGCLPMIAQFVVLIVLYRVFMDLLGGKTATIIQVNFLWLNLTKPDPFYIMAILAGLTQLVLSLMVLPATSTAAEQTLAAATPSKTDDAKADDMGEMAATMQKQMVFMMPLMTALIALRFPAGLSLYWIISTLFSIVQQYYVSGFGALVPTLQRYLPLPHHRA